MWLTIELMIEIALQLNLNSLTNKKIGTIATKTENVVNIPN